MNIRSLITGFALGVTAALATGATLLAQDHGQARPDAKPGDAGMQQPAPDEMQRMMKEWAASIAVGEQHKSMAKMAGTYDSITRMWMMGPDQPPAEFKGASEMKSVLGGRFLEQVDQSQMLLPDPQTGEMALKPMDGIGLFGYDNYQRMYVGCWASSGGTQLLTMRGCMTPDGKKLTMYAEMDEPMLGVRGRYIKCVTDYLNDDKFIFKVYDLAVDENYKVFEIEYTRRK